MSRPSMFRVTALVTMGLIFASPAAASTLVAAAFPGAPLGSGTVRCVATNVSDKAAELTSMKLLNSDGTVLEQEGPVAMTPGQTIAGSDANLNSVSPSQCVFRFKGRIRGSLTYINGTEVEVVPATK